MPIKISPCLFLYSQLLKCLGTPFKRFRYNIIAFNKDIKIGVVITLPNLFTRGIIFCYFCSLLPYLFIKETLYYILIIIRTSS